MPEKKLQELKTEREPLFRRLAGNPAEIHLALEIKIIDDQIAECNRLIQNKKRRGDSSPGNTSLRDDRDSKLKLSEILVQAPRKQG